MCWRIELRASHLYATLPLLNHFWRPRSRFEGDLEACESLSGSGSLTERLWAVMMLGTAVAASRHVGTVQRAGLGHTVTAE